MKRIAARVGVSLSTVSLWVRDIELDPTHRERNRRQEYAQRATTWRDLNRSRRAAHQRQGRMRARESDPLHQAGCMLYWAEGSKDRNAAIFSNSDPRMIRFFRRFLTACLEVPPDRLSLRLNVYTGNGRSIEEIERYWLEAVGLPRSCLRKHTLNHLPTSSSGKKMDKLPYGVCTLAVYDTRIAQHIYGAIQEYADFDEPSWLD